VLNYDELLELMLFVDNNNDAYTKTDFSSISYTIFDDSNDTITINLSKNNQI
jgi:hypothetical protein